MNKKQNQGSSIPDILGIGLPKAGTTWLYHILATQGTISTLPFKELRYLADLYLYRAGLWERLTSSDPFFKQNRFRIKQLITKKWRGKPFKKILGEAWWLFRYFILPRTKARYKSLFPNPVDGKMTADISPIYWRLPEEAVIKLGREFPETKVIILLREPISRAFSQAKMILTTLHGKDAIQKLSSDEFYQAFYKIHPFFMDYPEVVKRWESAFPGRVFVGFYDELEENPRALYYSICKFLSIEPDDTNASLTARPNQGVDKEIPTEFARQVAELYKPYLAEMNDFFQNSYTQNWVNYHSKLKS